MPRRILLAWLFVAILNGHVARAQIPFPRDLVPTRTALGRLGLERSWMVTVPLAAGERLNLISTGGDLLFAQTSSGNFYAIEAETGRLLWSVNLGTQSAQPRPASVNSKSVFVVNLNRLFQLDRKTGTMIWFKELDTLSATATTCDEDRVMLGLDNGKVYAFGLNTLDADRNPVKNRAVEVWNWQTDGITKTRPMLTPKMAFFGSDDGKLYASLSEERVMLYRIATGGAIGGGFGTVGTRTILVPSADQKLYAIDIYAAEVMWTFPSGAPILQEPLVADDDIYVVNSIGQLSSLEAKTGSPRWTTTTRGGRLVAIGAKRIYLESQDDDLFIVDRETGKMIADPRETRERAGLDLRSFDLGITNSINDRIFIATTSGLVLGIREVGEMKPRLLRDPKEKPFTYIPREGTSTTPPILKPPIADGTAPEAVPATAEPAADPVPAAEPGADDPK